METITIRNACIHNLKQIDVTIPKGRLVAITGATGAMTGAGAIQGLTPPMAVEQRITRQSNVRSVVGTRSRLLSYIQALYALAGAYTCSSCGASAVGGHPCPGCGAPVERLPVGVFSFNSVQGAKGP